jgi:hypothetical protein
MVSLRQAGRMLEADPKYLKGYAEAMGIKLQPVSRSLLMSAKDFDRLRKRVEARAATAAS